MKISAIDIGSNSVRLATVADGKTLYKRLETTRLGEGLSFCGRLKEEAIERTAQAVRRFADEARADAAEKIYAFATAAVRSSENGADFVKCAKDICGIEVEVLSGETEAKCGILGALRGGDGGIIDIGGASTEITVCSGGKTLYTKSVNVGTVRLFDAAGRDSKKLIPVIDGKIAEYGNFTASSFKMYAIGGTATRLAAVKCGVTEYRPEVTDGTVLTYEDVDRLSRMLLTLPVEEIRATTICKKSADVVGGGALLLKRLMEKLSLSQVTVSESDNLEGFIMLKEGVR